MADSYHDGKTILFEDSRTGGSPYVLYTASYTKTRTSNTKMKYVLYVTARLSHSESHLLGGYGIKASATINGTSSSTVTIKEEYGDNWAAGSTGTRAKFTLTIECSSTSATNLSGSLKITTTNSTGGTWSGNATISFTVAADALTYTVTYNANGGTGAPTKQTKTHGTNLTLSSTMPTRSSTVVNDTFQIIGNVNSGNGDNKSITANRSTETVYTFLGWGTSASDTSVDYNSGDTYSINANITLYAIWEISKIITCTDNTISLLSDPEKDNTMDNTYTVSLNTQGGDSLSDITANVISTYEFLGWGESPNSSEILDKSIAYELETTVYAIWEKTTTTETVQLPIPVRDSIQEIITVTLNAGTGTVDTDTINTTKTTSYSYIGWGLTESAVDFVSSYTPTDNTVLFAIWELNEDTELVNLPSAKKEGYQFIGWSIDETYSSHVLNPYKPSKSIVLYADFKTAGFIHVGNRRALFYVYHNGKWYQSIPNMYHNGSFHICG